MSADNDWLFHLRQERYEVKTAFLKTSGREAEHVNGMDEMWPTSHLL